ncbi:FAS1 domain-containing protein [Hyaloraphidium curvatum]|nr:FAS1 domain-containing protein [Hyaloraphidium curvatum]
MPSNITVFAPTDDAFKTFVASVGGSLPKSLEPLVPEILSYHISGSYIDLASLPAVSGIATLLNNTGNLSTVSPQLLLATKGGNTSVLSYGLGTAEVIDTLQCTNGVVQVVSSVLYPPNPTSTTLDLLNATAMAGIVDRAGLAPALDRDDRTLFVPTDEAFAAYSKAAGLDRQGRRALVRYHTVTKRIMSWDFDSLKAVTVGEDIDLPVRVEKGEVFVAGAKVVKANVLTANGVIHVIDRVSREAWLSRPSILADTESQVLV